MRNGACGRRRGETRKEKGKASKPTSGIEELGSEELLVKQKSQEAHGCSHSRFTPSSL